MKDHLCDLDAADRVFETKPLAPVSYCGRIGNAEVGYLELWTLEADIEGVGCTGTTVSEESLRRAGLALPNRTRP